MNLPDYNERRDLYLRAEAERHIDDAPKNEPPVRPAEELLHELQVHQVELEMQNEALRQAQIALAESRDRYVDLYEFAPVGYLTLGATGMIEELNLTAATLLGRERGKLLKRSFTSLIVAEDQDRWLQHILGVRQGHEPGKVELALRRDDGSVFHAQLDCTNPEGSTLGVRVALSDISERKAAEASRILLEAQMREAQKMQALGTLAGGVAHDFNNVLAAILGNVELARQDVGPAHPALESLREIRKASERAKHLVDQILAFGRRNLLDRKPISLAPVVEESARLLRATLSAGQNLTLACAPDAPAVLSDAMQIEQLIINLCNNGWQASKDEGRLATVAITLEAFEQLAGDAGGAQTLIGGDKLRPGRYACLSVRDNGSGMDEVTHRHLFEPFFTTKPVGEGTGLGLAVVHGIARNHEAGIQVQSKPGEGTTFRVYFPEATSADSSIPAEVQYQLTGLQADEPGLPAHGEHVLYVDDDESIVFLMKRMLERKGFRVSGYTRQDDALAAVRADPGQFNLAVTDYNMPGMSGLELTRALRQIRADLPIVMATGYITEELRAQAPEAGVSELVFKPDSVGELCDAVVRQVRAQRRNGKID